MDNNSTLQIDKAYDRFETQQDRIIKSAGYGDTEGALAITNRCLPVLVAAVAPKLARTLKDSKSTSPEGQFAVVVKDLPHEVIALCALQTSFDAIGRQDAARTTMLQLAKNIAGECWAAKLTMDNPKLAARIEKMVRNKHGSVNYRRQAARSHAAQNGFKTKFWRNDMRVFAGKWLWDLVVDALPEVFTTYTTPTGELALTITEGADDIAQEAIADCIRRNPVFLPSTTPARPWAGWNRGGPADQRACYSATVLRSRFKDVAAQTRHAITSGQMTPALEGLNALQGVAWKLNTRVLAVMRQCAEKGLDVPGLPPVFDLPMPDKTGEWSTMDDAAKRFWRFKASKTKERNRAIAGERVLFGEDLETAQRLATEDRFWTPMNMDWRGRVYAMTHFNFQREDRVRALFQFADGEEIGEDGLWWLKVHLANCGDFNKISKRPLEERVQWVDENLSWIEETAQAPLRCVHGDKSWVQANKPFLFLAACLELSSVMTEGTSFISTLPVSWDGSCSGLQHLAAMTRDSETAALVNLMPTTLPQDVYQTVATTVQARIALSAEHPDGEDSALAKLCLDHGIGRNEVKRNVMTYSYSSKTFGMASQQQTDLMEPLALEVLEGKREEHPFEQFAQGRIDRPGAAARYLAGHVYAAIEETVHKPALAMAFLQKCAKALAHEGKPLRWTTPTGIPWINRYHASKTKRLVLWMHDKGVKLRYDVKVAVGEEKEIAKDKAANGVAPNFVHALDAAHLSLTAGAAAREGIAQIATVHDSFGCLASRARRFNEIIREQFKLLYETHDVLAEVLAQAKCDLTPANWERLPTVPEYGSLQLTEVLNATFAFS